MELCLILWHVVMPPIARGHTWLYQPSPVSTVPNTGRNLSNSNYGGHDEEEEGMRCGKSVCLGGIHRTVYVMNWNVPQFFSNSKWNPHFISANLTEERYPLHDDASVFRNNQYALISGRYCIRCMQHHSRIELLMFTWPQQIFKHISAWHRTPHTFASRVDITSSFLHRIRSEQWLLADNVTILPCCLRSADRFQFLGNFPFPSCRIRCLIPAPLLSLWWLLINRLADCGPRWHQLF